ncbi:hypothetical protein EDD21DRAFT_391506 [Dissophora ornata]|nr:hypothetical protein EDD21DRAFT_391506 [Dissophora ornata]
MMTMMICSRVVLRLAALPPTTTTTTTTTTPIMREKKLRITTCPTCLYRFRHSPPPMAPHVHSTISPNQNSSSDTSTQQYPPTTVNQP